MTFISLTFVALLAFGSLGLPQAEETCGAYNNVWNEDAESSEGSCSRPPVKITEEDLEFKVDKKGQEKSEVAEPSFLEIIRSVINFIWMIFKMYTNWK